MEIKQRTINAVVNGLRVGNFTWGNGTGWQQESVELGGNVAELLPPVSPVPIPNRSVLRSKSRSAPQKYATCEEEVKAL